MIPILQIVHNSYDAFHGDEKEALYLGLAEPRVHPERQVVADFGQRYQRYKLGTLNGNAPPEIPEVDITQERFVDPLKVQGERSDEAFGRFAPVKGRPGCGWDTISGFRSERLLMPGGRHALTVLVF